MLCRSKRINADGSAQGMKVIGVDLREFECIACAEQLKRLSVELYEFEAIACACDNRLTR